MVFFKNYEPKNFIKYSFFGLAIHFIRALRNLVKGNPLPLLGLSKALIWFLANFNVEIKERYRIQRSRRVSDDCILQKIFLNGSFISIAKRYLFPVLNVFEVISND
jgi:hypothetical protein